MTPLGPSPGRKSLITLSLLDTKSVLEIFLMKYFSEFISVRFIVGKNIISELFLAETFFSDILRWNFFSEIFYKLFWINIFDKNIFIGRDFWLKYIYEENF